jgi:hypothetical protein
MIDLVGVAPGPRQGFVDVECENCGWFIFRNCNVDKRQLRLNIEVIANEGSAPLPPVANAPPVDPDDPHLPPHIRDRLKRANADVDDKNKAKGPCEEKLAAARVNAATAQAAADKAKADADAAEKAAKDAAAKAEQARKDMEAAAKAAGQADKDAKAAAEAAASENGGHDARKEAEADAMKAKEAAGVAQKAATDALTAYSNARAAAAKAKADAEDAKKRAAAAAKPAADAQATAAAQEKQCLKAQQAAAKAQAEKDAAEAAARAALEPKGGWVSPEEQLRQALEDLEKCYMDLNQLCIDQRIAMETLSELSGLEDEEDLKSWGESYNDAIGQGVKIKNLLGAAKFIGGLAKIPGASAIPTVKIPGGEYAITLAKAGIAAVAAGQKIGNSKHIPGNPSHDRDATKEWLEKEKKVTDPKQAERVMKEMENYREGSQNGQSGQLKDALDKAKDACGKAEQKVKDLRSKMKK